jgi:hypothetical protein
MVREREREGGSTEKGMVKKAVNGGVCEREKRGERQPV